ncbi:hypothetical protein PR048_032012 [Dryococelus australis]|uniref:Uncharacterized protein n=1 Tax=Dryococelus australis TaxID=614101 RepID=A0ABQ9G7G8_9NEOP|nr:hypothetical protein PR048_032012 [Dryococelus australis]
MQECEVEQIMTHCNMKSSSSEIKTLAWIDSAVFTRWLRGCDTKINVTDTKVVLFNYNCPAHPILESIRNIELVVLSKNIISMSKLLYEGKIQHPRH